MGNEGRVKEIIESEKKCDLILPNEYIEFLTENEGYFGDIAKIYDINELEERNESMQINIYFKNYIAIGDDGGGLMFLMKQERKSKEVIIVGMGVAELSSPELIINDFTEWYMNGFPIDEGDSEENIFLAEYVDIVLLKTPEGGVKGLLKIKAGLRLQNSAKELLDMTKKLPAVLVNNVTRIKAQKLISATELEELFELRKCD